MNCYNTVLFFAFQGLYLDYFRLGTGYDDVQVDNQPGRHNTTKTAFADSSLTQGNAVTCHRGCNQDGESFEGNNPVLSKYTKLHRKEIDLYQSLSHHQVLAKIDCIYSLRTALVDIPPSRTITLENCMAPENIHAPHERSMKISEGGVPEAEISKGYWRKNSNIFPGGPRTLSK